MTSWPCALFGTYFYVNSADNTKYLQLSHLSSASLASPGTNKSEEREKINCLPVAIRFSRLKNFIQLSLNSRRISSDRMVSPYPTRTTTSLIFQLPTTTNRICELYTYTNHVKPLLFKIIFLSV